MLIMLASCGPCATNQARLIFMMPVSWGQVVQIGLADAHDAGFLGAMWHQLGPADAHDAGFLMLASWGQVVQVGRADAHDAGFSGAMWHQLGLADAHDAGFLGPNDPNRLG